MDVQKLILFGMVAAVFALVLKSMKSEWGQLLSLAAALMIALYLLELCKEAGDFLLGIGRYVENASSYLRILLKAVGITYLCEFTANLSRDTGNSLIAGQIEICGKIAVLLLGIPILASLLQVLEGYL